MSLVDSLLGAIVRLSGESLVLHVGEKPYVLTSTAALNAFRGPIEWGQVELSTRALTAQAVTSMLDQLLTPEQRRTLDEIGAVDRELPATAELPAFTVIAARGGDDIWLEVRPIKAKPAAEAEASGAPAFTAGPERTESAPAEELHAPALAAPPDTAPAAAQPEHDVPAPSFEIVHEVEQEQLQEHEVNELLASAGLLGAEAHITVTPHGDEAPDGVVEWVPEDEDAEEEQLEEAIDIEIPAVAQPEPAVVFPSHEEDLHIPVLEHETSASAFEPAPPTPPVETEASSSAPEPEPQVFEPLQVEFEGAPAPPPSIEPIAIEPAIAAVNAPDAPDAGATAEPAGVESALEVSARADATAAPIAEPREAVVEAAPGPAAADTGTAVAYTGPAARSNAATPSEIESPADAAALAETADAIAASAASEAGHVDAGAGNAAAEAEGARPAVVLPMSRPPREPGAAITSPVAPVSMPDLDRLLRIAAARGASGLYLVAQSQPVVRVDGEMQPLDDEPVTAADVEAFTLALAPEPTREAVRSGATSEWFRDVPDLGRVRCLAFRDHRGPGVIVRMLPARAISVEQLGLTKEILALCGQPDGLVLVAGPRASGTSTLIAAFVDLINRSRADHVITVERQISFVHESRRSFLSQREVRGDVDELAAAVRTALREDPDVLVIEELRSADMIAAALEAADSGRLVLAGLRAPATVPALERLVEQFPAERRPRIVTALSTALRGVVGQVLLRKRGGGRIAARELFLNTPAAAALISEGKLFQLPAALESGRKLGSIALNDALAALIRDGIVDAGEAWRKAYDRDGLLTALKREGIDTTFVERLA